MGVLSALMIITKKPSFLTCGSHVSAHRCSVCPRPCNTEQSVEFVVNGIIYLPWCFLSVEQKSSAAGRHAYMPGTSCGANHIPRSCIHLQVQPSASGSLASFVQWIVTSGDLLPLHFHVLCFLKSEFPPVPSPFTHLSLSEPQYRFLEHFFFGWV